MTVASPDATQSVPDWEFVRRPFWIFSHVFAISVVSLFVVLGVWQLQRLDERRQFNQLVEDRSSQPTALSAVPAGDDLDYRAVVVAGEFIDGDIVRVGNRSQGGAAGEHVIGVVELDDGSLLVVNRGFVPVNVEVELSPPPSGPVELAGWLRDSVTREGFGAVDEGTGTVLPRLDTERVSVRLGRPVASVWLQLAPSPSGPDDAFPDPVPLPALDEGPHLSYAVQWFIFATLGAAFYVALLRRRSRGGPSVDVVEM